MRVRPRCCSVSGMVWRTGTFSMPMTSVTVYSTTWCPWCDRAKALLNARGIAFEAINIDDQPDFRQRLMDLTGGDTGPQIVIGTEPVGGGPAGRRPRPGGGGGGGPSG